MWIDLIMYIKTSTCIFSNTYFGLYSPIKRNDGDDKKEEYCIDTHIDIKINMHNIK